MLVHRTQRAQSSTQAPVSIYPRRWGEWSSVWDCHPALHRMNTLYQFHPIAELPVGSSPEASRFGAVYGFVAGLVALVASQGLAASRRELVASSR